MWPARALLVLLAASRAFAGSLRAAAPASSPMEPVVATMTRSLATIAIETKADAIRPEAYAAAKKAIIDAIGAALAGHKAPGVPETLDLQMEWGGKPQVTVWFHGERLPTPDAAFINSVQLHAMDLDDYHPPSDTHITAVLLPAILATAELLHASGRDALVAMILGLEVAGRIGREFKAQRVHEGFLPTSVVGGFAATAAVCRLKGLSVDQTTQALGIFFAHASGNRQALFDRTLTKRIQPAIAVRAAIWAAFLAKRGITGPEHVFEGEANLLELYAGSRGGSPAKLAAAPKEGFEVELLRFKKFACCGRGNDAIEAAIALANEHDLKPEDIERVEIFGAGVNSGMVGVPWNPRHPRPHVLAQFCAPYQVATAIRNRRVGPVEISDERIRADREVEALALRTELRDPKDFDGKYPGGQVVRVWTRRGETLVASRHTSASWLGSEAELLAKFRSNVEFSGLRSPAEAEALLQAIQQIETCADIARFVEDYLGKSPR